MSNSKRIAAAPSARTAPMPRPERSDGRGPFAVLLVEDNHGDVRLVREALADHQHAVEVTVAYDGGKALSLLRESDSRPDLILLDLKLPRMDGSSLLGRIKSDPKLRRIPVVVLTSSDGAADVTQAYDLHANCYLVKPPALDDFARLIRHTVEYWTGVVRLPDREGT